MALPIPVPGVDPGPDWANNLNACLTIVDSHNHAPGSGVKVPPSGLNINADLSFQSNNATLLRTARFTAQNAPITGAAPDLDCVYVSGVDLYYNDGAGNQVRITQGGAVAGSPGSISGLSSPASASYVSASGTFVWEQAASTAANMDAATLIIRYPGSYPSPSGNYIALQAPTSLATGYAITLPNQLPADTSIAAITASGSVDVSYGLPAVPTATLPVSLNASGDFVTVTTNNKSVSSSCGTFATSSGVAQDVTNLSVSITTRGAPVMLMLQADGLSFGQIVIQNGPSGGANARINFVRAASVVGTYQFGTSSPQAISTPSSSVMFMDTPAAGTYTYKVQAFCVSSVDTPTLTMSNTVLVAYELL